MIEHCRGQIASYKIPRYLRIVDEWPMSGTKIQKFKLREQIARGAGRGGRALGAEAQRAATVSFGASAMPAASSSAVICSRRRNFWIFVPDIGQSSTKRT